MSSKDMFYETRFDSATILKLDLYEEYIKNWLPVFISSNEKIAHLNIYDLFCGPGEDSLHTPGSPLRLLRVVQSQLQNITERGLTLSITFNDIDRHKVEHLKGLIDKEEFGDSISINFSSTPFSDFFPKCIRTERHTRHSTFIYIDQFGISALTKNVFLSLINAKYTDWMCFISSDIVHRMPEHPAISKYVTIPNRERREDIHKLVTDHYRGIIPSNIPYFLTPFSIKKGNNIYGIIFGTSHALGAEKFLRICWKFDSISGEANYHVDTGESTSKLLLPGLNPKKLEIFAQQLKEGILSKTIQTNKDIYLFTIKAGALPKHAKDVIKKMAQAGQITKSVNVSYDSIFRKNVVSDIILNR